MGIESEISQNHLFRILYRNGTSLSKDATGRQAGQRFHQYRDILRKFRVCSYLIPGGHWNGTGDPVPFLASPQVVVVPFPATVFLPVNGAMQGKRFPGESRMTGIFSLGNS